MKFFIELSFWIGAALFVIRIIEMAASDWPQERKPKSLGQHVAETIVGAAIAIWAGIILFAH